jgi:hypothetical protein
LNGVDGANTNQLDGLLGSGVVLIGDLMLARAWEPERIQPP